MLRVIGCIVQLHDLRLVTLAACICVLASGTTANLLYLVQNNRARIRWSGLLTTSIVFGCGIWALHFVAMLAYMPGVPVAYDVATTLASIAVAVIGTFAALLAWTYCPAETGGFVIAGSLLGLTISAMHFCGVLAMRVPGTLRFDNRGVLASIGVSILFATIAFARAGKLELTWRRVEITAWLALSVSGLHFTAMAALSIQLGTAPIGSGSVFGSDALGVTIGIVSFAILMVSLFATILEQSLSRRGILELQRMRLLSNISREALIIHRNRLILQVNAAGERMFGALENSLVGRDILDFIPESHHVDVLRATPAHGTVVDCPEIQILAGNGGLIPTEFSVSEIDYEGAPAVAMMLRDLTARKRDEETIQHLALHDALTDLPNRFMLQERVAYTLKTVTGNDQAVAFLHLDLDNFKQVNDLHGYEIGDAILVQVAGRLKATIRPSDTLARMGGDEFVIVTVVERPGDAATLAQRLGCMLAQPFESGSNRVDIRASIGIAMYPGDASSAQTLMHAADLALYRAKQNGRNNFRFFEPDLDEQLRDRQKLHQDLCRAIDQGGQLELHYQPLVSCGDGEVDGFEALVRWNHPERGLVSPADFIPIANETGLIVELGQWVLEAACVAAAAWEKPLRIAVNISPIQFRHSDFVSAVSSCLARCGLPAHRLEIEVTEDVLIQDTKRALDVLRRLREMGVRIAIDDFGTGYSNLSYLQSLRFDKLKIDKSFILRLGQTADAAIIVRAIVGLGHNLGLSITAEGVETAEQLAIVKELRCDQVQGFLIGRPLKPGLSFDEVSARARNIVAGRHHDEDKTLVCETSV